MKNFPSSIKVAKAAASLILIVSFFCGEIFAQSTAGIKDLGKASYKGLNGGKAIRSWRVVGPYKILKDSSFAPDVNTQEDFFNQDDTVVGNGGNFPVLQSADKNIHWRNYTSSSDILNFDSIYNHADYAAAYALAEIKTDGPVSAFLAIGSDDAVKVWLNGKLVHKLWIARGIEPDQDIIPVQLVKGSNQLLIKVQDMAGGWGFTARFLDKNALSDKLVNESRTGDLDMMKQMIDGGADVNKRNKKGQTPLDAARISGRKEAEQLLIDKGAKTEPVPSADKLIDGLYATIKDKPNPGIAILISRDGKIVYKNAFGYADIEKKIPVTPETKFRIGSITKQFVASAILRLQEEGKLKLTDKLSQFIPDFPRGNEVTIHHLLTHTSGIHSFTNKDSFFIKVLKPVTNEELLNFFKNDKYDFNPGEKYEYNNSGYFLLGYIIEKITGESFGENLKKMFFIPLEMNNTGVHSSSLHLEKEAMGYEKKDSGFKRALNWDMSWAAGAGALYSTVEDLYKWNEAIFNGKVLKPESLKAAFTPVLLNSGSKPPGTEYGYGWAFNKTRGIEGIGHSGGLHGFVSQLQRYPKENLTVVMLTNVTPVQVELDPNVLAGFYLWNKMDTQSSFHAQNISDQDLDKYAGNYDFSGGRVMIITKEGNDLFAQLTGQPKFQIFPSAPGEFFWKVVDAKIKFIKNDKGQVEKANFEQGGFKIEAPRLAEEKIIKLDSSVLNQFTGNYDYGNNVIITVTTANGKIFAQATGEQRYEILPLAENKFLIKELNAHLEFTKDAAGNINALKLLMFGQEKTASKVNK